MKAPVIPVPSNLEPGQKFVNTINYLLMYTLHQIVTILHIKKIDVNEFTHFDWPDHAIPKLDKVAAEAVAVAVNVTGAAGRAGAATVEVMVG